MIMSIHLSNLIQLYFNRNQKYLKHKKIILIMAIMATIIKVHHDSCREVNPLILKVFLTLFCTSASSILAIYLSFIIRMLASVLNGWALLNSFCSVTCRITVPVAMTKPRCLTVTTTSWVSPALSNDFLSKEIFW